MKATNTQLTVAVRSIGLLGPGLNDWASGQQLLREPSRWAYVPTVLPPPGRLPPAERRRAGASVKACIAVADQACTQAAADAQHLATVFTASSGDAANCHALCEALAEPQRLVSPTRFTNSVHNAAAGYWHIATASRAPSTSLSAHDASFAAGLLEAASQCAAGRRPVLLVAGDAPYPEPLRAARPVPDSMAVALLLEPMGDPTLPSLALTLGEPRIDHCDNPGLDALRSEMPPGRALPLLQALAQRAARSVSIEYHEGLGLQVQVTPGAAA